MIFYFLLPNFYLEKVFRPSLHAVGLGNLLNTISFSIITIPFTISALMYIFAGYLSDRTRTRLGKRRPFFLLVIPAAVCYMLLGINPNILISMGFPLNFIIIILLATGYAVLYRIIYCTYWSFYMDLTEPKERVNTSVIFNLFGMIGTIAAFIVPTFLGDVQSYFSLLIIVGLAYMGLVLFVFFFGPREDLEKIKEIDSRGIEQPGFIKSLKESIKNKNFRYYMILSFFYTVGYSLITTIFINFLSFKQLYIDVEFWQVFLVLIPVAVFGFYIYGKLAKKWTKIKAFKFGLAIGFIIQPFTIFLAVQGPPIFLLIEILIVFGLLLFVLIAILTFQYAILMDITPPEKEATYSGIYLFVTVIGMPVASGLIGPISDGINTLGPILNFWRPITDSEENVLGHDFSYALFVLIASILYLVTFLLLRKVKYKEHKEEKTEVLRDIE